MADLLAKHPALTSRVVLRDHPTAELGERLQALVITNKNKPVDAAVGKGKMLVVSAIHAREIATAETRESVRPPPLLLSVRGLPIINGRCRQTSASPECIHVHLH